MYGKNLQKKKKKKIITQQKQLKKNKIKEIVFKMIFFKRHYESK